MSETSLWLTWQPIWQNQTCVLQKSNNNPDFIKLNSHKNNPTPVTTMAIPYIKDTSETIPRIFRPYDIGLAYKPITTLRHILTNVKDNLTKHREWCTESNVLTARLLILGRLAERLTEHNRWAIKNGDIRNHIVEYHRLTKHKIDWNSAECVTYSTNYQQRLTLEIWYKNLEQEHLNRYQQLPAPYKWLAKWTYLNKQ